MPQKILSDEQKESIERLQQNVGVGQFYAVFYDDSAYFGRAEEISQDHVKVKFLHKSAAVHRNATVQLFDWPKKADIQDIPKKYIFAGPIELVGNLPFQIPNLDIILNVYKLLKKN